MKTNIISALCILSMLLVLPSAAIAQQKPVNNPDNMQIKGLVLVGLNLTQVDGDEVYGFYKAGLNAGVGAMLPLGKNFYFSVETLFNQKGAYKKSPPSGDSIGKPYYRLKLDYLDVPVMFYYEEKRIWTVGLGASWGRRVYYREIERGIPQDSASRYSKNDINLIASIQLRVWRHLKAEARYAYSIAKLRTRTFSNIAGSVWTRDQYHNIITLRLVYVLNEKYTPPQREKRKKSGQSTAYIPAWNH